MTDVIDVNLAARQRQIRTDRAKAQLVSHFTSFWDKYEENRQSVVNRTAEMSAGLGMRPNKVVPIKDTLAAQQQAVGETQELPYNTLFGPEPATQDSKAETRNRSIIGFVADTFRKENGRLPSGEELRQVFDQNDDLMRSSETFLNTLNTYNPEIYTGNQ